MEYIVSAIFEKGDGCSTAWRTITAGSADHAASLYMERRHRAETVKYLVVSGNAYSRTIGTGLQIFKPETKTVVTMVPA